MIHIGDIITLELKNSEQKEKYKCRLVDRNENEFYIDYPLSMDTNRTVFLLDGTQLNATFVGQDGTSVYLFETEIKGRIKKNIPMLVMSYPGDESLIKIQRRQYVRIETAVDIAIHPLDFEFQPFTAITDDVSAGGVSFLIPTDSALKQGMNVQIWLVLVVQNGEYHYLKLQGKIARILDFNETRNKVSLQFHDITSQERQLLLRFCFDRQLEIRRKGLY
ncbi:MAG TPA: flagellar brake domain-containing protein, partial [Bacillales bacterium]|nr:flagellar brake domain-containing protein [Bacillales bacterium]